MAFAAASFKPCFLGRFLLSTAKAVKQKGPHAPASCAAAAAAVGGGQQQQQQPLPLDACMRWSPAAAVLQVPLLKCLSVCTHQPYVTSSCMLCCGSDSSSGGRSSSRSSCSRRGALLLDPDSCRQVYCFWLCRNNIKPHWGLPQQLLMLLLRPSPAAAVASGTTQRRWKGAFPLVLQCTYTTRHGHRGCASGPACSWRRSVRH